MGIFLRQELGTETGTKMEQEVQGKWEMAVSVAKAPTWQNTMSIDLHANEELKPATKKIKKNKSI